MAVVDGLYQSAAGYVVLGYGYFELPYNGLLKVCLRLNTCCL